MGGSEVGGNDSALWVGRRWEAMSSETKGKERQVWPHPGPGSEGAGGCGFSLPAD